MKVIICSVPKSGTYLLANFLTELDFDNTNLHLNDYEFSNYTGASLKEGRENPEKFRNLLPFEEAIKKIEDNSFAVGHFSVENRKHLKEFKIIFLYRDLKDCLVSFGLWTYKTDRWYNYEKSHEWRKYPQNENFIVEFLRIHLKSVYGLFKKTVPWINENDILKLKYEDLTGNTGRDKQLHEYRKLTEFLGRKTSKLELERKVSNALNNRSLTKIADKKDYNFYKTKGFKKLVKNKGVIDLNKQLGYESFKEKIKTKFGSLKNNKFYDIYWSTNKKGKRNWTYGINIIDDLIENYKFKSVLDAGCGSADTVRYLLGKGYEAKGIELSEVVLKDYASDLLRKKVVHNGSLLSLPFDDNSFDVIFSSEVLEHIPEEHIPKVISEFYRVSRRLVFLTISLRPSSNFNKYHITLRSRNWWEDQFLKFPFEKDDKMISKLQKIAPEATIREILETGPTKSHIHEMEWFIDNPPYDFNEELEPWYFIFKKNGK